MTRTRLIVAAAAAVATAFACAVPAAQAADPCPNAAYRTGAGANLPDCRAYEQVTPADTSGQPPDEQIPVYPSPDGNRVLFFAPGAIASTDSVPAIAGFSSLRALSWSTLGLDPPADSVVGDDGFVTNLLLKAFSRDRSKVLVVSLRKLTSEAVEGASNFYVRDTGDRSLTLLLTVPGVAAYRRAASESGDTTVSGTSADLSRVLLSLPLEPGADSVVLVGGGRVSPILRDVDEGPIAQGGGSRILQPMSDDGRRVTFYGARAGAPSAVFQRVDGTSTVLISRSHRSTESPTDPVEVRSAAWPSASGTEVTFASDPSTPLTEDGPGPFYRWGADGDRLVNLLAGVSRPWGAEASFNLIRVSADGRYLWFTVNDFFGGQTPSMKLAVLDTERKRVLFKASFEGANSSDLFSPVRFSPDGSKMVGVTAANLTGYDQTGLGCESTGGRCLEAFYFDASQTDDQPVCISCGSPGTTSVGSVRVGDSTRGTFEDVNVVSDSGRAFFDTPQRLVSNDVNSVPDVYEYTPGRGVSLISSGTDDEEAELAGVTPSGGDVFFRSSRPLVPQDANGKVDLYDARVGGGLAAQQITPASGSVCAAGPCPGFSPANPAPSLPGTLAFRPPLRTPVFNVGRASKAARRVAARTGRLLVPVRVGAAGRVAGRATARLGRRSTVVAASSRTVGGAGRIALTFDLSRAARRALARNRKLSIRLVVSYSRAATSERRTVELSTPPTHRSRKGGAR